jgi:hypothetical protein
VQKYTRTVRRKLLERVKCGLWLVNKADTTAWKEVLMRPITRQLRSDKAILEPGLQ